MVGQRIAVGLSWLCGGIADIDFERARIADGLRDFFECQAGNHRGEEAARTDSDEVRVVQRVQARRIGGRLRILHEDALDGGFVQLAHIEFLLDYRAVHQLGADMRILFGNGVDARLHRQKLADLLDGGGEAVGHLRQSGDEEIAESHAVQLGVAGRGDAVLHHARQQRVVVHCQGR